MNMRWLPAGLLVAPLLAQMAQNPSPMVEHTRAHRRIEKQAPRGRREALDSGTFFLPAALKLKPRTPLLIFFHGGTWLPEVAGAKRKMAVIGMQLGSGSGTYAKAFDDPQRFTDLLRAAEQKAGVTFGPVTLGGWSAGCGAIRQILRTGQHYARVDRILCIDGIHTGYANGKPGPEESELEPENLQIWLQLARDAMAGRKRFLATHSEIFPGTFASTTETADFLLRELGLKGRPVLRWGPMGTQQLSEARSGRFRLMGYAGNSAPDHVDQLHSLPEYLKWFK
jgi:hypothetical protein